MIPIGVNSTEGIEGSTIDVNNIRVEQGPYADNPIIDDLRIHTVGNSSIRRGDFGRWSRWYQEDGNTQVFRLFEGEHNVRNGRANASRIEAYSPEGWAEGGGWHEWVGRYTVVEPANGFTIFQARNNVNDWSVSINLTSDGDVELNRRVGNDETIARDMKGKSFDLRVRDNGLEYEVFLDGEMVGDGSYSRPEGETVFRWGMYVGGSRNPSGLMMLFVTGAAIDP